GRPGRDRAGRLPVDALLRLRSVPADGHGDPDGADRAEAAAADRRVAPTTRQCVAPRAVYGWCGRELPPELAHVSSRSGGRSSRWRGTSWLSTYHSISSLISEATMSRSGSSPGWRR